MPNRIIKESICTSEEVDQLNAFQETVFYRLIVNCDDYGRMDARAKILKSKLFPLKDVRVETIEAALEALASAELVILYEVDGKPFLQMKTWDRHQRVRAKVSKYPAPADACCHLTADRGQAPADGEEAPQSAGICARNPIQSESESKSEANDNSARAKEEEDDGFTAFWEAFPQRTGDIRQAYYEYLGVLQMGVTPQMLLDAVTWQAKQKGRYMPSAEKWLRNKGWTEVQIQESGGKPAGRAQPSGKTTTFMDALQNRRREA